MFFQNTHPSGASAIVMERLLAALEARDTAREVILEPLGSKVVFAPDQATALIDPEAAPGASLATLVSIAEGYALDLLVLREVTSDSGLNNICCTAILASHPCASLTFTALEPWMKDGMLWLASQRARHSIRLTADGCEVAFGQPFVTPGQMRSGLFRAQAPLATENAREGHV